MNHLIPAAGVLMACLITGLFGIGLFEYGRKNGFHWASLTVIGIVTAASLLAGLYLPAKLLLS